MERSGQAAGKKKSPGRAGAGTTLGPAYRVARRHYIAAKAPGLVLLMEGYIAIVRQITGDQIPADGEDLHQITARIAAGAFEDGAEWIEQLRTALKVFALPRFDAPGIMPP